MGRKLFHFREATEEGSFLLVFQTLPAESMAKSLWQCNKMHGCHLQDQKVRSSLLFLV